ncbi:glutamine synthetase family protein [Helcobacillus massiliensis]|uniref:glutamine synthetase family protein n=1 Tax=Helcobacillus massiliensis TaxID=521392 RepID=UPI0021A34F26|nr:glutamine synthetase family protein [Helcobacillus massiliensis]MCT1557657.1 glutamine synthetase family protein [Helcobacillus massiliensis]MCT2035929.1 glutamine synthetase family protein [Helcobacillus massiliensis]MCT2331801.1 glutamine synthetase family protein [Helcobacillus massiliensis]
MNPAHHTPADGLNTPGGALAPEVRPRPGELVFLAVSDLSGITKGRAVRAEDFDETSSVGWVPANLGIGPLGEIVHGLPYGSTGDCRLRPDYASAVRITDIPGQEPHTLVFTDIVETDGSPWAGDSRTFLRDTVKMLEDEFGLTVTAAFEHEFTDLGDDSPTHPFSLAAHRSLEPIGSQIMNALDKMGAEPENWLPEYAPHQFEVTVRPTDAVSAADRAVLVRDTVGAVFAGHHRDVTFSPLPQAGAGGSGVHVHFGLTTLDGDPVIYDPSRPGRVSEKAAKFAAGILHHAPGMTAIFAPLVISGERLRPDNWSTARAFMGLQNREALLRITPTNEMEGRDPAPQLHFEFRGGDIGANPYLLLGSILRAGIAGLREDMDPAQVVQGDLDLEGEHKDLPQLPEDLPEALAAFQADEEVSSWFAPELVQTYLAIKEHEIETFKDTSMEERCKRYAEIF